LTLSPAWFVTLFARELSKHNVIARAGQAVVFRYNPHRRKLVVLFTVNGMAEASTGDNSS